MTLTTARKTATGAIATAATDVALDSGPLRLTRRGRIVVSLVVAALVFALAGLLGPVRSAYSREEPQRVEVYQVQPGDTLWEYAEQITPEGGDVRDTVRQIQKLNDMDTPTLYAGQRLVVPVDE
ncbi:LysM peptidoglycan-binding domain-containing protein [Pseudoscardovia radai]|uniref:LysM peptidoglycan-binding domain-containing protein n=1 Tax=Pseudoscardovia radai TaxID=987066 RepID=UPI0039954F81